MEMWCDKIKKSKYKKTLTIWVEAASLRITVPKLSQTVWSTVVIAIKNVEI